MVAEDEKRRASVCHAHKGIVSVINDTCDIVRRVSCKCGSTVENPVRTKTGSHV